MIDLSYTQSRAAVVLIAFKDFAGSVLDRIASCVEVDCLYRQSSLNKVGCTLEDDPNIGKSTTLSVLQEFGPLYLT